MPRRLLFGAAALTALLAVAGSAAAKPVLMPTITNELQTQHQILEQHVLAPIGKLQPPAPPCPENGLLPAPFSNCGLPEFPATTLPFPGNMAYWGGHVQASPKIYLVYWGWGERGAFANQRCSSTKLGSGDSAQTLRCDPDGAGRYMADFVSQLGGTQWAGVQTQYYQTVKDPSGNPYSQYITNPTNQLGGIWVDDRNDITALAKTSGDNPAGPSNTYTDLAAEAARAVSHFRITDLRNANIVIAQPPAYSDPNALSQGYCAFHDYTQPAIENGWYNGIKPGISYTNMPYQLAINSSGVNVCGENAVNTDAAGKLDGNSIVLGHEIEETVTDPGAEDIVNGDNLGAWYDAVDANENGDKCAWVGESFGFPGEPTVTPIPGAMGNIRGNRGGRFAVQSLWSNQAAAGTGYCAGSGTDLPQPIPAQ